MTTNKERIENLEAGLGGLQDNLSRTELGIADKLNRMEDIVQKLSEAMLSNNEASNSNSNDRNGRFRANREETREHYEGGRPMFSSRLAKLDHAS